VTPESLACQLNGREYRDEITPAEEKAAKAAGLVVVFGASDDLAELRGAVCDEFGAYDGGSFLIDERGALPSERDDDWEDDDLLDYLTRKKQASKVVALWCAGPDYSWTFKTKIPHATFDVLEDGEKYCRGIVFRLADAGSAGRA
jgi:hypothetical protein